MSLFKNSLKLYSRNIAVIDDNGISISYKDLESFSDFISENIPKRSILISLNKNTLGSIIGYYSFIRNNVVSFMIDQKTETIQSFFGFPMIILKIFLIILLYAKYMITLC